ncbi:hypothetical protein ABH14_20180 [Brevibacillus brevis]|nr:hypothetical protein [Brevibacillus brevis]
MLLTQDYRFQHFKTSCLLSLILSEFYPAFYWVFVDILGIKKDIQIIPGAVAIYRIVSFFLS